MSGSLGAYRDRLRSFLARRRREGRSLSEAVGLRLPLRALDRARIQAAAWIQARVITPCFNRPRLRRFEVRRAVSGPRFYVIVMPDVLHLLLACLRLLPPELNVCLLVNGATRWEESHLRRRLPRHAVFRLRTCAGCSLSHGTVLNLLLDVNDAPFGILDHDLFVLDPELFSQLDFAPGEIAIGAFMLTNPAAGLSFPTTQLLYLNTPEINSLRTRYRVGAQVYTRIPRRLQNRLAAIGLGYGNFLKPYLRYFDTLNLIWALALSEGLKLGCLDANPDHLLHLGGTSREGADAFARELGRRLLELEPDVRDRYVQLVAGRDHPPASAALAAPSDSDVRRHKQERLLARLARQD